MKNILQELNIIDFIRHELILNDQTMSSAQIGFLKSVYGLPFTDEEFQIYRRGTGRETYVLSILREVTLLGGRRGGKTGKVAVRIALYEAFRDHGIPHGERAYVMLIAPVIAQARIAFDFILRDIRNSPILSSKVAKVRKNEIELKNGVIIGCYVCSRITVRGRAAIAVICDEICFWRNEITSDHCDEEVLAALRPTMATFRTGKMVKISTPNLKRGVVYEEYKRRDELDYLVWHLTTQELNPTISSEFLEAEQRRSPEEYKREYLAEFVDAVNSWIEPEVLDRCVINGRKDLPFLSGASYAAAIDPAFKHSDFAMAIAHVNADGIYVLDCAPFWSGSKQTPLGFAWVCREIAGILKRFGLNCLRGDQFAAVAIQQEFLKLGISYEEITFGRNSRTQLFNNLRHLIEQRRIELLDYPELLHQLRSLEVHRSADGNLDIRPSHSTKDDLAVVLALCVSGLTELANNPRATPISFVRVSRPWDGRLDVARRRWEDFTVGQLDCAKFPKCWDNGNCECCENQRS